MFFFDIDIDAHHKSEIRKNAMTTNMEKILTNDDDAVLTEHAYLYSGGTMSFKVFYHKSSMHVFYEALPFARLLTFKEPLEAIRRHVDPANIFTMPQLDNSNLSKCVADPKALFLVEQGLNELIDAAVNSKLVEPLRYAIRQARQHIHMTRYQYLANKNAALSKELNNIRNIASNMEKHMSYIDDCISENFDNLIGLIKKQVEILQNIKAAFSRQENNDATKTIETVLK